MELEELDVSKDIEAAYRGPVEPPLPAFGEWLRVAPSNFARSLIFSSLVMASAWLGAIPYPLARGWSLVLFTFSLLLPFPRLPSIILVVFLMPVLTVAAFLKVFAGGGILAVISAILHLAAVGFLWGALGHAHREEAARCRIVILASRAAPARRISNDVEGVLPGR